MFKCLEIPILFIRDNPSVLTVKCCLCCRPEPHPRGAAQPPDSTLQEQEEEVLGSDDEEQEDPNDYCKGEDRLTVVCPVYC